MLVTSVSLALFLQALTERAQAQALNRTRFCAASGSPSQYTWSLADTIRMQPGGEWQRFFTG